jgi:hypothetical protein
MSHEIDMCRDSGDDNGERPNTALPLSSLPRSRERSFSVSKKRRWEKDASSNHANGPATGSAGFVVDLELANDHVEILPYRKRRVVVRSTSSGKNDAGNCAIMLKEVEATKTDVDGEDSEQTDRDDGSANKYSQKLSTSKTPSNSSRRQREDSAWEDRLSELADFHKIHGHCNVPRKYSDNLKLGQWVAAQRTQYRFHKEGKISPRMLSRIEELESLGFEWKRACFTVWEDLLSELAEYRKIHGHCNVPWNDKDNLKLSNWVANQRRQHRLHLEGKTSPMTTLRIQELESLGFEWRVYVTSWESRLSELADFRKIHGHCNIHMGYSKTSELVRWVSTQRTQYRWRVEGKKAQITPARIQSLESLGFEWGNHTASWEDRLSELADYCKVHGHCNVPYNDSENAKLGNWVMKQRSDYRLHSGNKSYMTAFRTQELESLGFEWEVSTHLGKAWENHLSELADYCKVHGHCNVPWNDSENAKLGRWIGKQRTQYRFYQEGKTSSLTTFRIQKLESLGFEWDSFGAAWEDRLSELADYRKEHGHCNVPQSYSENAKLARWVAKQRSHHRLQREGKRSPMTTFRIQKLDSLGFEWTRKTPSLDDDTKRVQKTPANSRQSANFQLETAPSYEILRATGYH